VTLRLRYILNKHWIAPFAHIIAGIAWCLLIAGTVYTVCLVVEANVQLGAQNDTLRQRIADGQDKASELIKRNRGIICAR